MAKGTTATVENNKETVKSRMSITDEDKRVYDSLEDAKKGQPEGKPNWSLYQVTDPNGRIRFVWSGYDSMALWYVASEVDHYSVISMDDVPTKSEVSGMLAALSKEDRAALIKEYAAKK
jgi:hypothetical protein